jgi:integrase
MGARGISPVGDRIQVRFTWRGQELRPTLDLKPTAPNLKHAARIRALVLADIKAGTLDLLRYFPDYRFMTRHQAGPVVSTFDDVKGSFLKWVRTRQKHASVLSLQRKLTSFWSPAFGTKDIRAIAYKDLSRHVADREWGSSKTHNNYVSALREMFAYALDHEYIGENPAAKLKMLTVQATEPHPYTVQEAEALVAQAHKTHGAVDGHYWHLAFLVGWRPGEAISLEWADWNRITGRLTVQRNRTEGEDSKTTKTSRARHVDLPAAAVPLLNALRALTQMRGKHVFIDYLTGGQIARSTIMQERWVVLHRLAGVDYREPYQCRHSSVSWKLMAGENFMKVAKNHGHSLATMLKTYAHWVESDSDQNEIERIRAFHGFDSGNAAERRSG